MSPLPRTAHGFYVADDLPVGTYSVTVEKDGFKRTTVTGNAVTAGGRLTVDAKLDVGTVTETVSVQATAITTNTTSGEISTTITNQEVENVPLNQRHYETARGLDSRSGSPELRAKRRQHNERL